jgi:hypothetical protein
MVAPERPPVTRKALVLRTGPHPAGFLSRYLFAFTPLVLFMVSFILTGLMRGLLGGSFTSAMQGPAGAVLAGMADLMEVSILLAAPVGIYLTFVLIGWMIGSTEMWEGSALALGLATVGGIVLVTISPETSLNRVLDLLYWVAYLAGGASLVTVILVLGFTEQFRRSISYTITREGLFLGGGVFRQQEHMLPWHQIGGLLLEQGLLGKLSGTGTIIPLGKGEAAGEGRKAGKGISRSPLHCLSGVKEPGLIMEFLRELITRPRGEVEEPALPAEGAGSR